MAEMFDYLKWRGDILFSQVPMGPVDALICSTLAYIRFQDVVPGTPHERVPLAQAAEEIRAMPDAEERIRTKPDLALLDAVARSPRYARAELSFYQDVLVPEEETQFAALSFLLDDGSAVLAFRGTDHTMVGWKEDFNMSFRETVPSQLKALQYLTAFAGTGGGHLYLAGHSKGGNLAMFAAARCDSLIQDRIVQVYNQDGPGFTGAMLTDPGYLRMLPKIHTYIPQSSLIGMLLEHEEPFTIIRSRQIGGIMQHNPYTWEVMGGDLVPMEDVTPDSKFINETIRTWLAGMDQDQRTAFFDTLFHLLSEAGADYTGQLMQPKQLRGYLRTLNSDEAARSILATQLAGLFQAARKAQQGQ